MLLLVLGLFAASATASPLQIGPFRIGGLAPLATNTTNSSSTASGTVASLQTSVPSATPAHNTPVNYTGIACEDPSLKGVNASQMWNIARAPEAWQDLMNNWSATGKSGDFSLFAAKFFNHDAGRLFTCGTLVGSSNCGTGTECGSGTGGKVSPAGSFILNSFSQIYMFYVNLFEAVDAVKHSTDSDADKIVAAISIEKKGIPDGLKKFLGVLSTTFSVISTFAWKDFGGKIDNFGSGSSAVADWTKRGGAVDDFLKVSNQAIDIGGKIIEADNSATADALAQHAQVASWISIMSEKMKDGLTNTAKQLFSAEHTDLLNGMIQNGNFLYSGGSLTSIPLPNSDSTQVTSNDLQKYVKRTLYWEVVLNYWKNSLIYPVIVASGADCSSHDPLKLVRGDVQQQTWACIDNELFYLVVPPGSCALTKKRQGPGFIPINTGPGSSTSSTVSTSSCPVESFTAPNGINQLELDFYLTRADFITGSVASWKANNKQNGWKLDDFSNDPQTGTKWFDINIAAPGQSWIPVCSEQEMKKNVDSWAAFGFKEQGGNFPCN